MIFFEGDGWEGVKHPFFLRTRAHALVLHPSPPPPHTHSHQRPHHTQKSWGWTQPGFEQEVSNTVSTFVGCERSWDAGMRGRENVGREGEYTRRDHVRNQLKVRKHDVHAMCFPRVGNTNANTADANAFISLSLCLTIKS